ncbi:MULTISPECIES: ABC transporter permease [unclassified Mesobacillus]|jgi:ABC-2 type transport system permease protein|uniref:ABC transporter permease n=1 Tax=unclassified Mesobacillus TaxID=2675270 RepID=UPI00203C4DF9|nr:MULTISPECIES: ABC transporter permease [unclassified Mesobacillus]MCM3123214.1 ABC transporter permease [Mesobacillus sp. MER 33]MCM3233303.1 ABC transporter permease [Mesobacillus sp. MER 48]
MGFWWLALKDALLFGRDKKALLTLVFMPILLIGILGAAFGNMMGNEEEAPIKEFKIGIVNLDEGALGKVLEEEVLMEGLPDLISAEAMGEDELNDQLKQQAISVGVILPPNFSDHIILGEESKVRIISIPSASIQSSIVESAVLQFAQGAAVNMAAIKVAGPPDSGKSVTAFALPAIETFDLVEEVAVKQEQKPVGSFQYYAAGMGVMFLLMTVITGVCTMIEEKEQDVFNRLLITKLTNTDYLIGKFIGLLFMSSIQFFIIIIGTRYLYGVDWGNSMLGVMVVGLSFVFSVCGLGVLLGTLVKTEKTFNAAGMLGTQIMAAVGGSMVPLYVFPEWMNSVVKILPNALALQTFLELMTGADVGQVLVEAGILIAIGVGSIVLAFASLSVKRRASHA